MAVVAVPVCKACGAQKAFTSQKKWRCMACKAARERKAYRLMAAARPPKPKKPKKIGPPRSHTPDYRWAKMANLGHDPAPRPVPGVPRFQDAALAEWLHRQIPMGEPDECHIWLRSSESASKVRRVGGDNAFVADGPNGKRVIPVRRVLLEMHLGRKLLPAHSAIRTCSTVRCMNIAHIAELNGQQQYQLGLQRNRRRKGRLLVTSRGNPRSPESQR